MEVKILENSNRLGKEAAKHAAEVIGNAIAARGKARIIF